MASRAAKDYIYKREGKYPAMTKAPKKSAKKASSMASCKACKASHSKHS